MFKSCYNGILVFCFPHICKYWRTNKKVVTEQPTYQEEAKYGSCRAKSTSFMMGRKIKYVNRYLSSFNFGATIDQFQAGCAREY